MDGSDHRLVAALERIERAVARIEAASAHAPREPAETAELKRLREAHALLRSRVETAIDEIDTMLSSEAA